MAKDNFEHNAAEVLGPSIKKLENEEFLLLVWDMENFEVERTNLFSRRYFGLDIRTAQKKENFFKRIIHPSEYKDFIAHTKTSNSEDQFLRPEEEKLFHVLAGDAQYKNFLFSHRILTVEGSKKKMMSIGRNPSAENISREESSVQHILRENNGIKEDKYSIIMNTMDDGFCIIEMIFDLKGKPVDYLFLETNPGFQSHVKIPGVNGKTMREIAPAHEEHWFETYGSVALTGKPIKFQNFAEKLDGTWFDVNAFPFGEENSRKVTIRFTNITPLKQTEEKLKKANELLEKKVEKRTRQLKENLELLQTVFDTTVEGIVVFRPIFNAEGAVKDFEYARVNKVIEEQYNSKDLVGRNFFEINPDAGEIGVFDAMKHTMETGESKDFEIHYNRNGYNNWFRITTKRQKGLLISSLEDITQKKNESEELKEGIRFKKQLTQTSPDIIMIFNLNDENVRYINRHMAPKPGMKKKDILGMDLNKILPFIHPLDREKAMDFHLKILHARDKEVVDIEFRLKSGNKNWEWFNARGKVFMRNKNGKVFEYIIVLRNIEEQKKTHNALIHAERLSIQGEFARTLAHELRNPMASIGMAADILTKTAKLTKDGKAEKFIDIIRRSTKNLNKLVTDLLNSSNYSPISFKKTDLSDLVEKTLQLANDRIYLSGIEVTKKFGGPTYIQADEEKLKIALLNIIINASEAMDPEKGLLLISIEEKDSDFELLIKDNGCGMDKEQLGKLFDSFYTQKENGLGIGLSSVKNIIDEHEATIKVESCQTTGTVFRIYFQKFDIEEKA